MQQHTLIYLVQGKKILLLKKAKGTPFEGQLIGFGGKIEKGEKAAEGAAREFEEESGLSVTEVEHRGTLVWCNFKQIGIIQIYLTKNFSGKLFKKSVEGVPTWLNISDLAKNSLLAKHQHSFLFKILQTNLFYLGVRLYSNQRQIFYFRKFWKNHRPK